MLLEIQKVKKIVPEEEFNCLIELFKKDKKQFKKKVVVLAGEEN